MKLLLTTNKGEIMASWLVEEEIGDLSDPAAQSHLIYKLQSAMNVSSSEISQAEAKERVQIKRELRGYGIEGVNFMSTEKLRALLKTIQGVHQNET